eukprot:1505989-Rhodomonas_salina.1
MVMQLGCVSECGCVWAFVSGSLWLCVRVFVSLCLCVFVSLCLCVRVCVDRPGEWTRVHTAPSPSPRGPATERARHLISVTRPGRVRARRGGGEREAESLRERGSSIRGRGGRAWVVAADSEQRGGGEGLGERRTAQEAGGAGTVGRAPGPELRVDGDSARGEAAGHDDLGLRA